MKPSEKITKLANYLYADNQTAIQCYPIDKIPLWISIQAILQYLDEELDDISIKERRKERYKNIIKDLFHDEA